MEFCSTNTSACLWFVRFCVKCCTCLFSPHQNSAVNGSILLLRKSLELSHPTLFLFSFLQLFCPQLWALRTNFAVCTSLEDPIQESFSQSSPSSNMSISSIVSTAFNQSYHFPVRPVLIKWVGVAQRVGCQSTKRKVVGSIPHQGACLGLRVWCPVGQPIGNP